MRIARLVAFGSLIFSFASGVADIPPRPEPTPSPTASEAPPVNPSPTPSTPVDSNENLMKYGVGIVGAIVVVGGAIVMLTKMRGSALPKE